MAQRTAHIAVIGDRKPLAWVLEKQRIAFPAQRYHHSFPQLTAGDRLYLYATRGAFHNPGRDRGRIIARTVLTDDLATLDKPIEDFDRPLTTAAPLDVQTLAPWGEGFDLSAHIDQLTSFPKPDRWAVYLRRSIWPITPSDTKLIDKELKPHEGRHLANLQGYQIQAGVGVVYAGEGEQ